MTLSPEDRKKLSELDDESKEVMNRIQLRSAMIHNLVKDNLSMSLSDSYKMQIIDGFDPAGDLRRIYLLNQEKMKIISRS